MAGEQVTVAWLVLTKTDSSFMVGVALALSFLPMAVLGLPAGALADWLERRQLLRALDAALAVYLAAIAVLLACGVLELWHILALAVAGGSLRAIYQPVRLSYAYDIVGPSAAVSGLSLVNLSTRAGGLLGAVFAGSLGQRVGPEFAFAALAGFHILSVAVLLTLRTGARHGTGSREPILRNIAEFLRELRTNRTLLVLVGLVSIVEVLGFSFQTALPELARDRLNLGAEGLGIMHAFRSIGGVLAILALSTQGELRRKGIVYIGVIAIFGVGMISLGAAPVFGFVLAALALVAGMAALSDVLTQTLMQLSVPDRLRGRAMGSWVFAIGSAPLGHLQMGALAAALGVSAALTINGLGLILLAVLAAVASRRLRRL
jgi:predicted MFS family arabinose efflux permease